MCATEKGCETDENFPQLFRPAIGLDLVIANSYATHLKISCARIANNVFILSIYAREPRVS